MFASCLGRETSTNYPDLEQPHWLTRHVAADGSVPYRIDENTRIDAEVRNFFRNLAVNDFWRGGRTPNPVQNYSRAQRRCLQRALGLSGIFGMGDFFRIWADAFHQARRDTEALQSLLVIFLDQNADMLAQLHRLSLPGMEEASAGVLALGTALGGGVADFCIWLLRDWLPPHLAYFHHGPRLTGLG
ncbi:hypothetical protein [Noviherbaspirillum humi]|nr:hypothetical protein [Noviherbaspirillum humi]